MTTFFRINVILFLIKIILILASSLTYYLLLTYIKPKYKHSLVDFYEINESIDKVFKDSYDIFISLTRKLDIYETKLIDCRTIGQFQPIEIPKIGDIKTPKFGNIIMKITSSHEFEKESVDLFRNLFRNNACEILLESKYDMKYCQNFWSGVLLKGLEQAIIQMNVYVGTVLDEIQSLNDNNNKTLLYLMSGSTYIEYLQFSEYYLFRAYNTTNYLFQSLRVQKLNSIIKLIKLILYIYIIISFFLFCLLIFFVYNFNSLFNSFLNYIGIFPFKYLYEDENFIKEIIEFGNKYF